MCGSIWGKKLHCSQLCRGGFAPASFLCIELPGQVQKKTACCVQAVRKTEANEI
jgi:hypothetical protein